VIIAATTALLAATIGILQNDIKKVLAYSTVSQLGYMFIGVGVTAYWAGIFHLMTHAFFKACLFLCSGSVIHAMGGEQDMRNMGGLCKKMPVTYITMLIATIAIAGIPPFAGFFSKDEILWKAFIFPFNPGLGKAVWFMGTIGAGITAFYMFRLIHLTFHGEFRGTEKQRHHLHESPPNMTVPLIVLAALSLLGGWLGVSPLIGHELGGIPNLLEGFLSPVFEHSEEIITASAGHHHHSHTLEWTLMGLSVAVAAAGIIGAYHVYRKKFPDLAKELSLEFSSHYRLVYNKYYVDEIYELFIVKPVYYLSVFLWKIVDCIFIDGIGINGQAWLVKNGARAMSHLQNGYIHTYGAFILLGVVSMLWYFFGLR
jgi:NADH-quinone oxidoreductase subunit L